MIEYTVKVYDTGDAMWFLGGKLHREDGPACEFVNGYKEWYLNGELHREDGPAIEWADGSKWWYLNGKEVSESDHAKQTAPAVEMTIEEICEALGKKVKVVK